MQTLQRRIQMQSAANDKWIERMKGIKVTYGTLIQLRHKDSGMYLQFAKSSSDLDRNSHLIELSSYPSA